MPAAVAAEALAAAPSASEGHSGYNANESDFATVAPAYADHTVSLSVVPPVLAPDVKPVALRSEFSLSAVNCQHEGPTSQPGTLVLGQKVNRAQAGRAAQDASHSASVAPGMKPL